MNINMYSVINNILSNLKVKIKLPEAFSSPRCLLLVLMKSEKFQLQIPALQPQLRKLN